MIRFFLHGWYIWVQSEGNKKFFRELLEVCNKKERKILIVPFARAESRWEEKRKEVEERFFEVCWKKRIRIELASNTIAKLKEQILEHDIIFIWWWETIKLQKILEKIGNLKEILEGKMVAWSSAGALVFSKFYYENDTDSYHEWLSLLLVGMICHWKSQKKELAYIKKYWWVKEILCIPEWEFIIREC